MELPEHLHQLLRLDRVDEAGPSAEVGEEHRDLAAMAAEDRIVTRGDDRVDELRREEPPELLDPLELQDLGFDPVLERPIQLGQLRGLRRDRVVVALDPQERPDPREQFVLVERLGDQIVRARLGSPSVLSDVLAVIMITGNIAVSSRSRIRRHTAYPSGCGITTSSITRSGLADATSSSAPAPSVAETTS